MSTSSPKNPPCDWFEIISENYMVDGGRPLEVLDQILEQYKVVQHGVSMYFGSTDRLNREHLIRLKYLVKRTKTPFLSDHLCWGSVDGTYSHDLLPLPYTFGSRRNYRRTHRAVRDFLEVPICVENVSSYAEFHVSEMTEWEFLTEVVEQADCGILLDVNNIYVSAKTTTSIPSIISNVCRTNAWGRFTLPATANLKIYSRYARSPGARSGLENVRSCHRTVRSDLHPARMGRPHPQLSGSPPRVALSAEVFLTRSPRRPRMKPPKRSCCLSSIYSS